MSFVMTVTEESKKKIVKDEDIHDALWPLVTMAASGDMGA